MKPWTPLALGLALTAGAAYAQPINENPPTTTIQCIDVSGRSIPARCQVPASRIDQREDICLCDDGQRVEASICPAGVREPAEGVALMRARREALRTNRSLVGATFRGQPMCVAPRQNGTRR
ncbi:hypothetical protein [Phenylobacterium sp.]|jgi:hypothetical protein|uniref:hypothetical protein n=1 Tax=Phenylobacterium sp. TaxID=1871053 RepID=UPI002F940A34